MKKEKKKPKPLSISPSLHKRIADHAGKEGLNFSRFTCDCMEICLELLESDNQSFKARLKEVLSSEPK